MKLKVIFGLSLLLLPFFSSAAFDVPVVVFYGDGCPHCEKAIGFLREMESKYPNISVELFEVYKNKENIDLMREVGEALNVQSSAVPLIVIGEDAVVGYLNDATSGAKIEQLIEKHSVHECRNVIKEIEDNECDSGGELDMIDLPFFGSIDVRSWSSPALTLVIAALDGFNPCAMWVLIFLISLLLGMENRRKMWALGLTFIAASAISYFLFLAAWLNLFLFIGFIGVIRIIIGLVAIGGGGYHLREFWTNKDGVCKVTNEGQKAKIAERFQKIIEEKAFWPALIGIVVLAFAINLIELVCSAGLPAIYAQILSMSQVSSFARYAYLILYIVIFMLDDIIVFVVAMTTLKLVGIDSKYGRWSSLIGGIIIFILGLLLIFKPEWILFG